MLAPLKIYSPLSSLVQLEHRILNELNNVQYKRKLVVIFFLTYFTFFHGSNEACHGYVTVLKNIYNAVDKKTIGSTNKFNNLKHSAINLNNIY